MMTLGNVGDALTLAGMVLLPIVCGALMILPVRHLRRGGERPSWHILLLGNFLVFAFMLAVLLLAGECYYRFWYDATDSFGLSRVSKRWFERHYQYNASGLRDSLGEYTFRKGACRRITFLGDSFTAGHGIADVEDRFVNRIRRQAGEWEVHALAINGFDTGAELQLLQDVTANGYELDQVVLVYCLNDIADMDPAWQLVQQRAYESDKPAFFFMHSFYLNTLYYRFKASRDPDISDYYHFVLKAYDGPLWERQKTRLAALRDLVAGHGGRLLVVTFPFLHQLRSGYEYGPVHERLAALWHELGVPELDLLPLYIQHYRSGLVLSRYDSHPNRYAHGLASEAILAFLRQNMGPAAVPRAQAAQESASNSGVGK